MMDTEPRLSEQAYEALAARRLQWDGLLWQVPSLSMTAQAFLMTIALGAGNERTARIIASLLSLVAAAATLQLFASNRRSEVVDAHLLEAHELGDAGSVAIHGVSYRERRNSMTSGDRLVDLLCRVRSYRVWLVALTAFAVASVISLCLAIFAPGVLGSE